MKTSSDSIGTLASWGFVLLMAWGLFIAVTDISKEQHQYIEANKWEEKSFLDSYCNAKERCAIYGKTLLSCAEAGNANTCVKIKLGGQDFSDMCGLDGRAKWLNENVMPSAMQCFKFKYLM